MTKDVSKKIKDIASRFCSMSFDEILNLPDPEGYEYIDQIYDQLVESRQKRSVLLNAEIKTNNVINESNCAYKTLDLEKIECNDSEDIVYGESDLIWAA
jgi:hypothetical protein